MANILEDLLPSAADCARKMAEAEAEKASDYARRGGGSRS